MARVSHFDMSGTEPDKLIPFYQQIFGWKFEKVPMPMDYWLITTGSDGEAGINGGMSRRERDSSMLNTISVKNIDEILKKVAAAGGKVEQPKGPIPGVGWFAQIRDPQDNVFGLMQDDPSAR
jgi:predicted enzyme related to lactoylglutathione lyase